MPYVMVQRNFPAIDEWRNLYQIYPTIAEAIAHPWPPMRIKGRAFAAARKRALAAKKQSAN